MKLQRKDLAKLTNEQGQTILNKIKEGHEEDLILRIVGLGAISYMPKVYTGAAARMPSVLLLLSRSVVKTCRLVPKSRVGLCQDYDVRDENNALLKDLSYLANVFNLPVNVLGSLPGDKVFDVMTVEPSRAG